MQVVCQRCLIAPQALAHSVNRSSGPRAALLIVLETNDNPPDWSVDVLAANGTEYEVKVNA
jgi:hypothetical protein